MNEDESIEMDRGSGTPEQMYRLRSYQTEMVEQSMQANIIVVMDTGSGKTHIAIERTRAELEICHPAKLIWFLTPTVTLCEQQYETFKKNLPGYGIRMLSGNDNVERWTKQSDWDAILANVRIVLSTHQVLLDALTHAFVSMRRLALLIFDEAHHASQNHPANRIMSNFFLPHIKEDDADLPRILGLSASPVMKAKASADALKQVEQNLHAEVRVPRVHRSELMRHVHMPEFIQIHYGNGPVISETSSPLLAALDSALFEYDILQDPYCINLIRQHHEGYDVREALGKVLRSQKTYCSEQLKILCSKAKAMAEELGQSPMNWYLHQCMMRFEEFVDKSSQQLLDWSVEEKEHLLHSLQRLPFQQQLFDSPMLLDGLSQKVEKLLHTLVEEMHSDAEFTGLVFIEQRLWVAALAEIISIHPKTKDLFRVGTYVGTSQYSKRKANIATLPEPRNQQSTLDDFRSGSLNLILATSVLEEGIDISSCHLVICFERPKNLKSFVQRRGRARRQKSKYLIFRDNMGTGKSHRDWQSLENEMRPAYVDELRQVELAEELELQREDGERVFRVPETGALLTLDNACQHLYHFCSILASGPYIDARPQFSFNEDPPGQTTAHVVLPILVDPAVRTAKSSASWRTERMARKEAAFEAYKALYHAGLVNNNLLPARDEPEDDTEGFQKSENQPSLVPVKASFDPWQLNSVPLQSDSQICHRLLIQLTTKDQEPMNMLLHTPVSCPEIPSFILHWNKLKKYEVYISQMAPRALARENIQIMREITHAIFHSVYHSRMQESRLDFHWLLLPCNVQGEMEDFAGLSRWKQSVTGTHPASDRLHEFRCDISSWGLVEVRGERRRYIPHALVIQSDSDEGVPLHCLKAIRMPKRRNFLYAINNEQNRNDAHTKIEDFNIEDCMVENLPVSYTIFALLFPSILHKLSTYMLADKLRTTVLNPIQIDESHINTLITAITSSGADEKDNYQRFEFLGDCILKFVASVHLMASNLTWPESYLSGKKSRIVSNGSLTRAALEAELERFIIFDRFTGVKWSPRYATDVCEPLECAEQSWRSSKVVADVVESLIGASYIVGGLSKAALCIKTLLPSEPWMSVEEATTTLYDSVSAESTITGLTDVESIVGHTFRKKMLLLEALTHASFTGAKVRCSYERLEFLGDAVLDYIISHKLSAHQPTLSHRKMHTIRTAMVNAAFLTFRMFETTAPVEMTEKITMQPQIEHRGLWQYMRASGHQIIAVRENAVRSHKQARDEITTAFQHDARYPWHLLALTTPPKFLSDIVESVIGAIYVDAQGALSSCEAFVQRLGILDCLERVLRDGVDCLHPKERLGHLAVDRVVEYVRVLDSSDSDIKKNVYRCQVRVGGKDVGGVVEGLERLNAETIAAFQAIRILERVDSNTNGQENESDDDEFFDAEDGEDHVMVG